MHYRTLAAAGLTVCLLGLPHLAAHGGTYRGPGDTVPPGAGGGNGAPPSSGDPNGPGGPGNGNGPTTGSPANPNGSGNGRLIPGTGGQTDTDLAEWTFWWETNKDPFLNLKAAIHAQAPTTGEEGWWLGEGSKRIVNDRTRPNDQIVFDTVVPVLRSALASSSNRDIVTGCMIALAKIGDERLGEGGESETEALLRPLLRTGTQQIRETAALALGILASPHSIALLEALALDSEEGREAVGSTEVDSSTRAFAAHGLGLVGHRATDEALRQRIVRFCVENLEAAEREALPDLAVGLVTSIGLTPLSPGSAEQAWSGREAQIAFLMDLFHESRRDYIVRAHLPVAAGRLLEGLDERLHADLKQRVADGLMVVLDNRKNSSAQAELRMSAALALGQLGDADEDVLDAKIRQVLIECDDAQRQVERFATLALGKIAARAGTGEQPAAGRAEIAKHLLRQISRGKSGADQWAAMTLGVQAFLQREVEPDAVLSAAERSALLDELASAAEAQVGAYAIASGLAGDPEAGPVLLKRMREASEPSAVGYLALGIGLLGERRAMDDLRQMIQESEYQPEMLRQAAIALGLLGDRAVADDLVKLLGEASSLSTQAAIASALGFIGDVRAVQPLAEMLADETLTETARGFAAVALGLVADKEALPWNAKLAIDVNYRAATGTLSSLDGSGLLNIL